MVEPVSNESRLRYIDWVRRNREKVLEKTGGKIGYVHLPNMEETGSWNSTAGSTRSSTRKE